MPRSSWLLVLLVASLSFSISTRAMAEASNHNLLATLWMQQSAENDALSAGIFHAAAAKLDAALADPSWTAAEEQLQASGYEELPPAVILDVDETALSNADFQARIVLGKAEIVRASWQEWCNEAAGTPIAGALEFCLEADRRGIAVFYVTNRSSNVDAVTEENLRRLGFPLNDDEDRVLTRGEREGWTGDKGIRRAHVASSYRIIMLLGDNLGDFSSIGGLDRAELDARVTLRNDWWGERWFMLPNPLGGSWLGAIVAGAGSEAERLEKLRGALETLRR